LFWICLSTDGFILTFSFLLTILIFSRIQ
jgi:hypothetical protein